VRIYDYMKIEECHIKNVQAGSAFEG